MYGTPAGFRAAKRLTAHVLIDERPLVLGSADEFRSRCPNDWGSRSKVSKCFECCCVRSAVLLSAPVLFLFFSFLFLSAGVWVKKSVNSHTSTYQLHVVFRCNPRSCPWCFFLFAVCCCITRKFQQVASRLRQAAVVQTLPLASPSPPIHAPQRLA